MPMKAFACCSWDGPTSSGTRPLVCLEPAVHVCSHGLAELLLRYTLLGARDPVGQPLAQLCKMARHVHGDAEVDQREPRRRAPLQLVERPQPRVQVELGWRRG